MTQGLDRAYAPSPSQAKAMLDAIGGSWWNVYIGGPQNGGVGWTPSLIAAYASAGVQGFLGCYVGEQTGGNFGLGTQHGQDAVNLMRAFGFAPGSPVALDVEGGTWNAMGARVFPYIRDWTAAVQAGGFKAGIYGSPSMINAMLTANLQPLPDFPWPASWIRHGVDASVLASNAPVSGYSSPERRVWQYAGGPAYVNGLAVDINCADLQMGVLGASGTLPSTGPVVTPPAPPAPAPAPAPLQSGFSWYQVSQGDTMSGLAVRFGITLSAFEAINHDLAPNPNLIRVGQRLRVPAHGAPTVAPVAQPPAVRRQVVVRPGDSLSAIAGRSRTTLGAILAIPANAHFRANPNLVYPGQVVYLP